MAVSIVSGKRYAFMNWDSRTVFDLAGGSSADGTPINGLQAQLPGNQNQVWIAVHTDGDWFAFQNPRTSTYLTLSGGNTTARIVGEGGNTQYEEKQWRPHLWNNDRNHTYSFSLQNRKWRDRFIDLDDASDANGTILQGMNQKDAGAQRWIVIEVPIA